MGGVDDGGGNGNKGLNCKNWIEDEEVLNVCDVIACAGSVRFTSTHHGRPEWKSE